MLTMELFESARAAMRERETIVPDTVSYTYLDEMGADRVADMLRAFLIRAANRRTSPGDVLILCDILRTIIGTEHAQTFREAIWEAGEHVQRGSRMIDE
jgi:hypothetical protein